MSINTKMNDYQASQHELAGKRILEFDWDEGELKGTNMQPQPMKIWEGIEVIGCTRGSG